MSTTYALVREAAGRDPEAPVATWLPGPTRYDEARTVTAQGLLGRVDAVAHVLHDLGVRREDAVALLAPNCSDLLAATLAAEAVGVAMPVNPALDVEHLRHLVALAGARVAVVAGPGLDPALWRRIADAAPALGLETLVVLDPDGPYAEANDHGVPAGVRVVRLVDALVPRDGLPTDLPRPDDLAAFFHTGGTTGAPKLAAHTHANQASTARAISAAGGVRPGETIVAGLPLFHVNALLVTALAPLAGGGHAVWPSPLGYRDPDLYASFWRLIEHYRAVAMSAVPTVYAFLSAMEVDADISTLRMPVVGASPLPEAVRTQFRARTGLELHEGYGLTEATCASTATRPGDVRRGSVGVPLDGQRVVAATVADGVVTPLPEGEVGEVVVAGPAVFAGYVRREAGSRTLSTDGVVVDGWLRTGDLGEVVDGHLHLRGRAKDLIIRGGHNIDPMVVEEALLAHPAVRDASAVGAPDRRSGEVPVAYVVLDAPASPDELVAWAAEHVAERAAAPRSVTVLDALPVTDVGKPFKPALRADAARRVVQAETGLDVEVGHRAGRLVVRLPPGADPGPLHELGLEVEVPA
jgi:fatty-acyl-CoA synthase